MLAPQLYYVDLVAGELLVSLSKETIKVDPLFFEERREVMRDRLEASNAFRPVWMKGFFPVNEELP